MTINFEKTYAKLAPKHRFINVGHGLSNPQIVEAWLRGVAEALTGDRYLSLLTGIDWVDMWRTGHGCFEITHTPIGIFVGLNGTGDPTLGYLLEIIELGRERHKQ